MYYPKAKITENQFTGGGLLKDLSTGETFRGYYHITFDGKYFTGATHNINSKELSLLQPASSKSSGNDVLGFAPFVSNFNYNNLTKNKMGYLNQGGLPVSIYPTPSPDDYSSGQFTRFFMQRIGGNSSDIKEITEDGFQNISKNPLYTTLSLIWKLIGPKRDTILSTHTVYGIADTNGRTINRSRRTMKGLEVYLRNTLELARITEIAPEIFLRKIPSIYNSLPVFNGSGVIIDNVIIDSDGSFIIDSDGSFIDATAGTEFTNFSQDFNDDFG